jgi:hypothetical protein
LSTGVVTRAPQHGAQKGPQGTGNLPGH